MSRVTDFLRRREATPKGIFDQAAWEDAQQKISSAYATEGYIYANVRPVVERARLPHAAAGHLVQRLLRARHLVLARVEELLAQGQQRAAQRGV